MRASLTIWIVSLLFTAPASAGGTLAEKIGENPSCGQFNDGCSICKISQGAATCSSPSIACINTGWHCVLDPMTINQNATSASGTGNPQFDGQDVEQSR